MPRLIGELLTIWFVNIIGHVISSHVVAADQQHSQVIPCSCHLSVTLAVTCSAFAAVNCI